METVKRYLGYYEEHHLESEIIRLNQKFNLNLHPTYSIQKDIVRLTLTGDVDAEPKSFNFSSYHIYDLLDLVEEKYKKLKSVKLKKHTAPISPQKIQLPRPQINLGTILSKRETFSMQKTYKVIIVDDDLDSVGPVDKAVKSISSTVSYCMSGADAIAAIPALNPDLVILDWHLGDSCGEVILEHLDSILWEANKKPIKIITYSALEKENINLDHLIKFDRVDHWCKPISIDQMKKRLALLI